MSGTIFGQQATKQIIETVRRVARQVRNETPQRGRYMAERDRRHWAVLQEDLVAAVDFFTNPSVATARLLRRDGSGDYVFTNTLVTVVNRFMNISLDEDTIIGMSFNDGVGLTAEECSLLHPTMVHEVERYSKIFPSGWSLNEEGCPVNGIDRTTVSKDYVQEFVNFIGTCGGFSVC